MDRIGSKYNIEMSKLSCKCGNIIVDQVDSLPNKADIIPDSSFNEFMDHIDSVIEGYLNAEMNNTRDEWFKNNFNSGYPSDLPAKEMISDLVFNKYDNIFKQAYQCEMCGRLYVQLQKSESFASFKPENNNWKDILDKIKS